MERCHAGNPIEQLYGSDYVGLPKRSQSDRLSDVADLFHIHYCEHGRTPNLPADNHNVSWRLHPGSGLDPVGVCFLLQVASPSAVIRRPRI